MCWGHWPMPPSVFLLFYFSLFWGISGHQPLWNPMMSYRSSENSTHVARLTKQTKLVAKWEWMYMCVCVLGGVYSAVSIVKGEWDERTRLSDLFSNGNWQILLILTPCLHVNTFCHINAAVYCAPAAKCPRIAFSSVPSPHGWVVLVLFLWMVTCVWGQRVWGERPKCFQRNPESNSTRKAAEPFVVVNNTPARSLFNWNHF